MKAKLNTIREALEKQMLFIEKSAKDLSENTPPGVMLTDVDSRKFNGLCNAGIDTNKAIATTDTLIAELESPELVDTIEQAIDIHPFPRAGRTKLQAQAAINAIKG